MSRVAMDDFQRLLASSLLPGVVGADREEIFRSLAKAKSPSGTALLTQGQTNERLWLVLDGSVAIERMQANGRADLLATLSGPAMYGTTTFFRSSAPSATIRAITSLAVWTLDHPAHDQLRRDYPRAAEALALEVVRVLAERFDQLDDRLADMMAQHEEDHPRSTEWANFRARLFEEPSL